MRVLLSGYTCDPNGGSESANTWYTALELARAGAEVHLLTRESDADRLVPALDAARIEGASLTASFLSDDVPRPFKEGQLGVYAKYLAFQRRVRAWSEVHSFDIGHHVSWGSLNHPVGLVGAVQPLIVGPVGGGQYVPPELEMWVDGGLRWQRTRRFALTHGSRLRRLTTSAPRSADLVLVTNPETEALARTLGAQKTARMPPDGVRSVPTAPDAPGVRRVVWIGRFLPIKGASLAAMAFRELLSDLPDAELWFIGDGPTRADVESQCRDLLAADKVRFLGSMPWPQAQEVLATATAHLFTGLRDSFSAQALEAAAVGVPTVAIDQFGLQMFCRRDGFVLASPTPGRTLPTRLAAALALVLTWSPHQWCSASTQAQEFAGEHTYAAHAAYLLSEYRRLLD